MNKFDGIPKKENPEVRRLYESFGHYIGHFILKSRMLESYHIDLLNKTKESLLELLNVCKNEKIIAILKSIQEIIDKINLESKLDDSIFEKLNKLLDELGSEQKY